MARSLRGQFLFKTNSITCFRFKIRHPLGNHPRLHLWSKDTWPKRSIMRSRACRRLLSRSASSSLYALKNFNWVLISFSSKCFPFHEKLFRKIDDGRYQHLCKVDFHGVHISTGKGHNKSESKKDASAFAIKLVAPNVYKELLSEHASSTAHLKGQNEKLPSPISSDMPQVAHRKLVMQEEVKNQSIAESPMKIVG